MKLIQVEMIRAQPAQRPLQLCSRAFRRPLHGFACEKNLISMGFERASHFLLGFPIAIKRGHIKIVDSPLQGFGDNFIDVALLHVYEEHATEAENRKPDIVAVQSFGDLRIFHIGFLDPVI